LICATRAARTSADGGAAAGLAAAAGAAAAADGFAGAGRAPVGVGAAAALAAGGAALAAAAGAPGEGPAPGATAARGVPVGPAPDGAGTSAPVRGDPAEASVDERPRGAALAGSMRKASALPIAPPTTIADAPTIRPSRDRGAATDPLCTRLDSVVGPLGSRDAASRPRVIAGPRSFSIGRRRAW
jgi:hypothetical protein